MGSEYIIKLSDEDEPVSVHQLKEILCRVKYFYGLSHFKGTDFVEFRSENTKNDLESPPDVNVATSGREICICQFGDYEIAAQVIGVLSIELCSESNSEKIIIGVSGAV